jgi:hypothetical protein
MKMRDHRNAPGIPGVNKIVQDCVFRRKEECPDVVFLRALATQHIQGFLAFFNVSFKTVDNEKNVVTLIIFFS